MPTVKAQKVPNKTDERTPEDYLALFCYHFPQYTYAQARKLPAKRIFKMLKVAEKEYARKMYDLAQIVAAPHTKKMTAVQTLLNHYKSIMEG